MEVWKTLKFAGAEVYLIGGSVRDPLLGIPAKDQDILIRNLPFEQITAILREHGKIEVVGNSFQVLKFISKNITYDITFPRLISKVTRYTQFPEGFDPFLPLEIDLAKRDFTINAIAKDFFTDALIDPLGGMNDLKEKKIRMVSHAAFEDDPLRILRGAQLAARLEFSIEPVTLTKMEISIPQLEYLPGERIKEELVKTLTKAKKPSICFDILNQIGALKILLPGIADCQGVVQNRYHSFDVYKHTMILVDTLPKELILRLAGLYHDTGKKETQTIGPDGEIHFYKHEIVSTEIAKQELSKLRFSNEIIHSVSHLIAHHLRPLPENHKSARRFISKIGPEFVRPLLTLMETDSKSKGKKNDNDKFQTALNLIEQIIEEQAPVTLKQLAITGKEIVNLGVPEGPLIGKILYALLEQVIEDPNHNHKEHLLEKAQHIWENLMP